MNDPVKHLLELGAQSVGGKLMYRQKVLGTMKNGIFQITSDGEQMLNVVDAVVVDSQASAAPTVAQPTAGKGKGKGEKLKAGQTKVLDVVDVSATDTKTLPLPGVPLADAPDMADLDKLLG